MVMLYTEITGFQDGPNIQINCYDIEIMLEIKPIDFWQTFHICTGCHGNIISIISGG